VTDEIVQPELGAAKPNPHLLAYDFFKHMSSLSVLTLGGMLTLSESVLAEIASDRSTYLAMALMALAGATAILAQNELVEWAHRDTPRPKFIARWGRLLTTGAFGAGVGAFLAGLDTLA